MSLHISHFYRFAEFTLDTDQRVLLREGKRLPLTTKVFDTLLILVENTGRIVEKEELMNRLWPDTFVEEANLTFNIKQLRKSLGDDARNPAYIETIARRGRVSLHRKRGRVPERNWHGERSDHPAI